MIREDFPPTGSTHEGGLSDGWQYQIRFRGSNLQATFDMVKAFLTEQGYADLPLPKDSSELLYFRLPTKQQQISLFNDNGYSHNPIKILFDPNEARPRTLILCLFNEKEEQHLLKFHGKI
jgi:hypothetical protein